MGIYLFRWGLAFIIYIFNMKMCQGFGSCSGSVTITPKSIVPVGSDVSIMCVSTVQTCWRPKSLSFTINDADFITPTWMNKTVARHDLHNVTENHNINCFLQCIGSLEIVCWATLHVGYAPDLPRNVSCTSDEHSTVMTCTWNKGRETLIHTNYTVHVKNLQTSQIRTYVGDDSVQIQVDKTQDKGFTVYITAENALGRATSLTTRFQWEDIVVPVRPEITKIEIQNTNFRVSIQWKNKTEDTLRRCELSYRTLRPTHWVSTGEQAINETEIILSMEVILEADALRARCREERGLGYWSDWSVPENIPQTEPLGKFDVWRVLGPVYPSGHQEVTILIKPNGPEPPWAKKKWYNIYYKDGEAEISLQLCVESPCTTSVPKETENIFIVACNMNGSSQPSSIFVHQDNDAFPAPRNLTVTSRLVTSIAVHWVHPKMSKLGLLWFVVQWEPEACDDKKQQNVSWLIVPKEENQYNIEEIIEAGRRVTVLLFAVYASGMSKPSINYGFTQELKPRKGPTAVKYSEDQALVQWGEVPVCYQNGFVVHYTLHLKEVSSGLVTRSKSAVRYYSIKDLKPDEIYELCVSASTIAGEGPVDQCQLLPSGKALYNYTGLLIGMVCTATALASFTVTVTFKKKIRARIKIYVVSLMPKCLHEDYPHIENSMILKDFENDIGVPVNHLLLSDPEITEVEEVTPEKPENLPYIEYKSEIQEHIGVTEDIDSAENNFQEMNTGYRPQISKIDPLRSDSYCAPPHLLEIPRPEHSWDQGNDWTDQDVFLWNSESTTRGIVLPETELLVTDVGDGDIMRFFQVSPRESDEPGDIGEVKDLLRNQLRFCLPADIDLSDTKAYFPQVLAKGMMQGCTL